MILNCNKVLHEICSRKEVFSLNFPKILISEIIS